ncbi:MAG: MlaD family protein [Solirubrobacteraceae bacterium]
MRRAAGLGGALLLAALVLAGCAGAGAGGDGGRGGDNTGGSPRYWVELDNAFGLVQGGDMKVAGVRAGKITKLDLDRKTLRALVEFQVTENGFGSLRADVSCETRPQSLIGEYYLDCAPGTSPTVIKPGSVIPVTRTTSTVAPDLVLDTFRLPYRERLRIIINELGAGAAGNAANLRAALRRASPALRQTDRVLAILARQNQTLANLARDGDQVLGALAANRRDVARFVENAGRTTAVAAARRAALAEGIRRLPAFLSALGPAMTALGGVAGNATPALANLNASAVALKAFLDRLGPFAAVSRPAFRALGRASVTGRQALSAAAPTVAQLATFATPTPELAKNLNIVLQHLDDRSFAVEKDPRSPGGQGYTGLEALLNYVFYQATSTTLFDANNHLLNVDLFASLTCSPYPDPAVVAAAAKNPAANPISKCRSWLGPSQPGITTPDPTATAATRARLGSPAANPTPTSPAATGANPQPLQNTTQTPTGGVPTGAAPPAAPLPTLTQLVGNVVNGLPNLPGALSHLLGVPPQRSSARTQKQLLDYLLAP